MQSMTGNAYIGTGHDRYTRTLQLPSDLQNHIHYHSQAFRLLSVLPFLINLDFQLRRDFRCTGLERFNRLIYRTKHQLQHRISWIDYGSVIFKELQSVHGIGRVQINGGGRIVSIAIWEEASLDVVEVINLVHPSFNSLQGVHALGDMTSDGHAQPVGLRADHFQRFQLYLVSDLDLFVAGVLVTLDGGACFFRRFDLHIETMPFALSVDVPGKQH